MARKPGWTCTPIRPRPSKARGTVQIAALIGPVSGYDRQRCVQGVESSSACLLSHLHPRHPRLLARPEWPTRSGRARPQRDASASINVLTLNDQRKIDNRITAYLGSDGRLVLTAPEGLGDPDGGGVNCGLDNAKSEETSATEVSCAAGYIRAIVGDLGGGSDTFDADPDLSVMVGGVIDGQVAAAFRWPWRERLTAVPSMICSIGAVARTRWWAAAGATCWSAAGAAPERWRWSDTLGGRRAGQADRGLGKDNCRGRGRGMDIAKNCETRSRYSVAITRGCSAGEAEEQPVLRRSRSIAFACVDSWQASAAPTSTGSSTPAASRTSSSSSPFWSPSDSSGRVRT